MAGDEDGGHKTEKNSTTNETDLPEQPNYTATEQPKCKSNLEISECVEFDHVNNDLCSEETHSPGTPSELPSMLLNVTPSEIEQKQCEIEEPVETPAVESVEKPTKEPAEEPVEHLSEEPMMASDQFPHTCSICRKTFRHAATLSRHQNIHIQDTPFEDAMNPNHQQSEVSIEPLSASAETEVQQKIIADEILEESTAMESGTEDQEKKEERNEEEDGSSSSEHRGVEEENESPRGRSDKRKKICNICNKRFWSLQDLTRHTRSHTGERPYQCPTCDRTFTLKHSLVRHQRIHQKAPDGQGADRSDPEEADGSRDNSALDGEEVQGSGSESEPASGKKDNRASQIKWGKGKDKMRNRTGTGEKQDEKDISNSKSPKKAPTDADQDMEANAETCLAENSESKERDDAEDDVAGILPEKTC